MKNKSGFIVRETLMYTTAVALRKFIQTFLVPPPPSARAFFCLTPSVSLMFRDAEAGERSLL